MKIKLFCIPYSGGNAAIYIKWTPFLSENIVLCPIELAGRGRRMRDSFYNDVAEAGKDLASLIASQLEKDEVYAIYGHSLGSLLAYETYYNLLEMGIHPPCHMFFSGRKAPQNMESETDYYLQSDEEFLEAMFAYGGNTKEAMQDERLRKIFLPILRADIRLDETYIYNKKTEKIACNITIINGNQDQSVKDFDMREWEQCTQGECSIHEFTGDHFFLFDDCLPITELVNRTLK
jgi:medium-chain acyl-[acyl-carrier-protein] hydrolase